MLSSRLRSILPGLKEKYGSIYALDVSEYRTNKTGPDVILLRAMTRAGFNLFSDSFLLDPVEAVQSVISTHTYGYDLVELNELKAGVDEYICSAISKVSGFASEESLAQGVEDGRKYAHSLEAAITIYICKAFPQFTPKDVDNLTFEEQMRYVALAEQMIGKELPYLEFLNPRPDKTKKKVRIPQHLQQEPPMQNYQYSYGGKQAQEEDIERVVVTKDNLKDVMKQTQEIFGGGPQ